LPPKCVLEATRQYLAEQDMFGAWVDQCCQIDRNCSDTHEALFGSWSAFMSANGEEAGSGRDFHERMASLPGVTAVKHTPGVNAKRGYLGIGLQSWVGSSR
jgi:phage/plasmid-associated DNA primase